MTMATKYEEAIALLDENEMRSYREFLRVDCRNHGGNLSLLIEYLLSYGHGSELRTSESFFDMVKQIISEASLEILMGASYITTGQILIAQSSERIFEVILDKSPDVIANLKFKLPDSSMEHTLSRAVECQRSAEIVKKIVDHCTLEGIDEALAGQLAKGTKYTKSLRAYALKRKEVLTGEPQVEGSSFWKWVSSMGSKPTILGMTKRPAGSSSFVRGGATHSGVPCSNSSHGIAQEQVAAKS